MVVWRPRGDGLLGCSTPCILCRRRLVECDVVVHFVCADSCSGRESVSGWFHGRMTDAEAPASKPTSGQIHLLGIKKL